MSRIVIRPRVLIVVLALFCLGWATLGVAYVATARRGDEIDMNARFVGGVLIIGADRISPWSEIKSIDCVQIRARKGVPFYAPVIRFGNDSVLPVKQLGSTSMADVERRVEQLGVLRSGAVQS